MQLDKFQEAVVNSPINSNLLVVGAPGSGKTRTLTTRYAHLYINGGIEPSRILVLTFSKKAAGEMSKRISKTVDLSNQAKNQISTINAFCYRLYNDWRESNGMKPLKVWQYGDKVQNPQYIASDLMQKHLSTSDLSLFDQINKTLKSHPEPLPDHLKEIGITGHKAQKAHRLFVEYETWMKENNLTDFYGQVWNVDRLMHKNPIFALMVGQRFDKILADEVQDFFPQTYRIMLKLAEQSSIEMFGDPSQSIYGFNGAAPHLLYKMEKFIKDITTHHLSNNYRSQNNIVKVVNNFGPRTTKLFNIMFPIKTKEAGNVSILGADSIADQGDLIADEIDKNGFKFGDVYALARTNGQCSAIYQRLIQLGVPANYAGNFSIWDKSHMKAAISYLAITKGQDGMGDLENIVNIPSEDYKNVFGQSTGKYSPTRFLAKYAFQGVSFTDLFKGNFTATRAQRPGISNILKFVDHLRGLDDDRQRVADIGGAISKWAQWSGMDYFQVEDDLSMLWDRIENMDYDVNKLRISIQKMKEAKRKIKPGRNRVEIMTIHQAKGLEALIIFLTGLSEPIYGEPLSTGFHPGRNVNPNINEENCLFYTGISRAIEHLYLTYYYKSGDTNYGLSSFVTDFTKGIANGAV